MNKMKGIMACFSLLVLMVLLANTGSAQAYYTDEYFKEHFGEVKTVATPEPKYGVMLYLDSDAYYEQYGRSPTAAPPVAEELPLEPEEETEAQDTMDQPPTQDDGGLVVIPVKEDSQEPSVEEPTDDGSVVIVPVKDEVEDDVPSIVITDEEGGELVVDTVPDVIKAEQEEAVEDTTEDTTDAEDVAELEETQDTEEIEESEESEATTGAAVSDEGGLPFQIVLIGFLIIVIIVMLVILLTKEEGEKKEEWEEGDFFKETSKKDKDKSKEKSKAKKADTKKSEPKKKEEKKDSKKDSKDTSEKKSGSEKKSEVKPFLLKIKDEVE